MARAWLETRTTLLARLKGHSDESSWEELVDSYGRVVHAVAIKAGLPEADAEDLVQETVVEVARRIGGFDPDRAKGSFKAWLLTIARSRIVDCLRKRGRQRRFEPLAPAESTETTFIHRLADQNQLPIEEAFEQEWRRGLYDAARERIQQRISPQQYQIFDLYVVREWPVEKIAAALHVTPNQIYLAKHRVGEAIAGEVAQLERARWSHPPKRS